MKATGPRGRAVDVQPGPVAYAGVDTHKDSHVLALTDAVGGVVSVESFPADAAGYDALAGAIGNPEVPVGIEGACSYGQGLADRLEELGYLVVEMIRPKREQRRKGKSDPIDAIAAARNLAAGKGVPRKVLTGAAGELKPLLVLRDRCVKESTSTINVIESLLVTAPEGMRSRFRGLAGPSLVSAIRRCRAKGTLADVLRSLARKWKRDQDEAAAVEARIKETCFSSFPALVSAPGIGPICAARLIVAVGDDPGQLGSDAAFSMLCGTSPIPVSSGRTDRHRLNRGGNRVANAAIHEIAETRVRMGGESSDYVARKMSQGKTRKEAMRCLCRYVARDVFRLLTGPQDVPDPRDLRELRESLGVTRAQAARELGTNVAAIRNAECMVTINIEFLRNYVEMLARRMCEEEAPITG